MKKQILITIGREYGSGGHDLAALLSQRLGIRMLDRELIEIPAGKAPSFKAGKALKDTIK